MAYMYQNECEVCDRTFSSVSSPRSVCDECHNSLIPYAKDIGGRLKEIIGLIERGRIVQAHRLCLDAGEYVQKHYAKAHKAGRQSYKIDGKWDTLYKKMRDKNLKDFT